MPKAFTDMARRWGGKFVLIGQSPLPDTPHPPEQYFSPTYRMRPYGEVIIRELGFTIRARGLVWKGGMDLRTLHPTLPAND